MLLVLNLSNIDPYKFEQTSPVMETKKGSNVTLNGANYITEKTIKTFENALKDGYKIKPLNQKNDDDFSGISISILSIFGWLLLLMLWMFLGECNGIGDSVICDSFFECSGGECSSFIFYQIRREKLVMINHDRCIYYELTLRM